MGSCQSQGFSESSSKYATKPGLRYHWQHPHIASWSSATAALHRDSTQELGWRTGDSCLLSKAMQTSELLISTTLPHNCCWLQIMYRILYIRHRKNTGPCVSQLCKSCRELQEGAEVTLNIAQLKESYYPSTLPCPGPGVSPQAQTLTWPQPLAGHGGEQEGCSHGRGRNQKMSKNLSTESTLFSATHFQSKRNIFSL